MKCLSHLPQVKVYPLTQYEHGADDVLVLGTDGLWDVLSNEEVAEAVTSFLANCDPDDQHRHVFCLKPMCPTATRSGLAQCWTSIHFSNLRAGFCFIWWSSVMDFTSSVFQLYVTSSHFMSLNHRFYRSSAKGSFKASEAQGWGWNLVLTGFGSFLHKALHHLVQGCL